MQIAIVTEKSITFKLSDDGDDDASAVFGRVMNKCVEEAKKKGFRNMFTSEERSFLKEFSEKITYQDAT
jgi:hypothetical protein